MVLQEPIWTKKIYRLSPCHYLTCQKKICPSIVSASLWATLTRKFVTDWRRFVHRKSDLTDTFSLSTTVWRNLSISKSLLTICEYQTNVLSYFWLLVVHKSITHYWMSLTSQYLSLSDEGLSINSHCLTLGNDLQKTFLYSYLFIFIQQPPSYYWQLLLTILDCQSSWWMTKAITEDYHKKDCTEFCSNIFHIFFFQI